MNTGPQSFDDWGDEDELVAGGAPQEPLSEDVSALAPAAADDFTETTASVDADAQSRTKELADAKRNEVDARHEARINAQARANKKILLAVIAAFSLVIGGLAVWSIKAIEAATNEALTAKADAEKARAEMAEQQRERAERLRARQEALVALAAADATRMVDALPPAAVAPGTDPELVVAGLDGDIRRRRSEVQVQEEEQDAAGAPILGDYYETLLRARIVERARVRISGRDAEASRAAAAAEAARSRTTAAARQFAADLVNGMETASFTGKTPEQIWTILSDDSRVTTRQGEVAEGQRATFNAALEAAVKALAALRIGGATEVAAEQARTEAERGRRALEQRLSTQAGQLATELVLGLPSDSFGTSATADGIWETILHGPTAPGRIAAVQAEHGADAARHFQSALEAGVRADAAIVLQFPAAIRTAETDIAALFANNATPDTATQVARRTRSENGQSATWIMIYRMTFIRLATERAERARIQGLLTQAQRDLADRLSPAEVRRQLAAARSRAERAAILAASQLGLPRTVTRDFSRHTTVDERTGQDNCGLAHAMDSGCTVYGNFEAAAQAGTIRVMYTPDGRAVPYVTEGQLRAFVGMLYLTVGEAGVSERTVKVLEGAWRSAVQRGANAFTNPVRGGNGRVARTMTDARGRTINAEAVWLAGGTIVQNTDGTYRVYTATDTLPTVEFPTPPEGFVDPGSGGGNKGSKRGKK